MLVDEVLDEVSNYDEGSVTAVRAGGEKVAMPQHQDLRLISLSQERSYTKLEALVLASLEVNGVVF